MKYLVKETVKYTTVVNGKEVDIREDVVRTPVIENNKINALCKAIRFMDTRIASEKEDTDKNIFSVEVKKETYNTMDILMNGGVYCIVNYLTDNGTFVMKKMICELVEE